MNQWKEEVQYLANSHIAELKRNREWFLFDLLKIKIWMSGHVSNTFFPTNEPK